MDKVSANTRILSMAIVIAGLGLAVGISPPFNDRDFILFVLLLIVFIPWAGELIVAPYAVRSWKWWSNITPSPVKPPPQTPPGH